MVLTYHEIAMKYGIPVSDISVAVNRERLTDKGRKSVETCKRQLRLWDETEVIEAVVGLYMQRANHLFDRGKGIVERVQRLTERLP